MAILENKVYVNSLGGNVKYYEELGYKFPRYTDKRGRLKVKSNTHVLVSIKDLSKGSNVKVTKICDICGKHVPNQPFNSIQRMRKNNTDMCISCSRILFHQELPPKEKSLWSTHPEIASLLNDKDDGYRFTYGSSKKVSFKCKDCSYIIKNKQINIIVRKGLHCPRCSDGISYPEKFMFNMLQQFNIKFDTQRIFTWSNNKRYDFYISSLNCIIETHGEQHYKDTSSNKWSSLEEVEKSDKIKEKMAKENGIEKYIVIDCRRSELEFIKHSVLNSELDSLFNLLKINWEKCHEFSCANIVKQACELWNNGIRNSTTIGEILKVARNTARDYLKQGAELGWCDYDPQVAIDEIKYDRGRNGRCIVQLNLDGIYIDEWKSISEASKETGVNKTSINQVCRRERRKAGGFKWMYKEDYIELSKY